MKTQDFYQSALYTFGQDATNLRFNDDFFKALDFAQRDFCTRRRWGYLRASGTVTTVESVRTADLPDNFGMLYDVRGAIRLTSPDAYAGNELTSITEEQYWQSDYDADEEGVPDKCWLFGTAISFTPIPDDEYEISIRYLKRPASISDAQSVMTVPDDYHEAIQHMVRRRLQANGYSSVIEIQISDEELNRLIGQFARDDIARYGGLTVNLPPSRYTIETT